MRKPRKAPPLNNAADIEVKFPNWVWYPYIPANCATMLFGAGGLGKSYMAASIASYLSCGKPLPGQDENECQPHRILFMSAEDSPSAVIKPRLLKCGANLSNIFIPSEPFVLDEWGLKTVYKYMHDCAASFVIIDPVAHYMGGKIDMNKMNEVRQLTGALHQHAMANESSLMFVHHSRKGSEGEDYEKAAGSMDFVNAVRSVLYVNRDNKGEGVMMHVKTNYGTRGPSLSYSIDHSGFYWGHEVDDSKIFKPHAKPAPKQKEAIAFLRQMLRSGPIRATELMKLAEDQGITSKTVKRAKKGVAESIMRYVGEERCWFWRLENDPREPADGSQDPRPSDNTLIQQNLMARGE